MPRWSTSALTRRSVFVLPMPPFQPCTTTTVSPLLMTFSCMALERPHLMRRSTSSCQLTLVKSGLASGNRNVYTPRYRWAYRDAEAFRVTMKMGQTGRYLDRRRAESPEVDKTTIPPALQSCVVRLVVLVLVLSLVSG